MKNLSINTRRFLVFLPLGCIFLFFAIYYFFLEPMVFSKDMKSSLFLFLCIFSGCACFLSLLFLLLRLLFSRFHRMEMIMGILFFLGGETAMLLKGILNLGLSAYDFIFFSVALLSFLIYFALSFSLNELDSTKKDMEGYL